jgi:hypothetical protein
MADKCNTDGVGDRLITAQIRIGDVCAEKGSNVTPSKLNLSQKLTTRAVGHWTNQNWLNVVNPVAVR